MPGKQAATAAIFATLFFVPAMADTQSETPAHPVVWHVKGTRGGEVTLFGSLHVLPANTAWLTPEIGHALSRTDIFVFEAPTDDSSRVALNNLIDNHGYLPEGKSLRELLPPDSQTDYDAAISTAHLSPTVTDREQPWLVSLQLSLANDMNRNYFPDAGVDYVMMSWATKRNRPVRYLETVDQQFQMLLPASDNLRLEEFESGLKRVGAGEDHLAPLVIAWSKGDVAKLGALMDAGFANQPEAKKTLVTDRNRNWAKQIEAMLKENRQNFFITVGAAHLTGPDGVPALLRADGYEVDGP